MTAAVARVVTSGADCFAILIGINAYTTKPLKGCVNDVRQIKKYLEGLPFRVNVQTLTGTGPSNEASPLEEKALRPTYDNVIATFQKMTSMAKPGDHIYIHFSGHGTRVDASEEFSNESTGDLALVLLENENEECHSAGGGEHYLRGVELATWLKAMLDKGAAVTLVLDCCFSAAVYRYDDLNVRYLPYSTAAAAKHPPALLYQALSSSSPAASLVASRDASMLPNWLINPEKHAIIAACGPDQEAKELQFSNGQRQGILSHLLLETWRRHGGVGSRHKTIYRHLCTETNRWAFRQHPILYGDGEQTFFKTRSPRSEAVRIALVKRKNGCFEMLAGQAHGVRADDRIVLTSMNHTSTPPDADISLLTARITDVRGLTSDIEILNAENHSRQMPCVLEAEIWTSFSQYRIKVDTGLPHYEELIKSLQSRSFDTTTDLEERHFSLLVASDEGRNLRITNGGGQRMINLPDMNQQELDIEGICVTIEHLLKYQITQKLANENPSSNLHDGVDVRIAHHRGISRSGDVTTVQDGDICELTVENTSSEDIYIFAYGMGPEWQIDNLLKATYEVIPPRDILRGLKGFFRKKLKMTLSPGLIERGHHECQDIVKVIVTKRPTSFDLLELPKLGEVAKKTLNKTRREEGSGMVDNWTAYTFILHTCCRSEDKLD